MLIKDKVLKGRYRVIDQLGQEETGAVYEAYDSIRKANVALKEILIDSQKVPAISERENLKRTFADRAKVLAEVKHESLPQIRGYFSEFDRQYLVIELINGDNASELLSKNEKPMAFSDAANWADQLLDALDYLHTLEPPIIHGDVKPQNVKLNSRGRIKLLGFDITESAEAKVQTIVGNPNAGAENLSYLSLEQLLRMLDSASRKEFTDNHKDKSAKFLKQPADARSDIYALGASLYHLMTGQLPVDALERTMAIWAQEFDPLPSAKELNPLIPIEISDVLMKAMEIEPEKRFGSAMEMRQGLQTAVARAQEREAEKAKAKENSVAREMLLAEEKKLEQERRLVEKERLRLEEERQQQAKLLEQQLKAAEAERLKAEQRAADAEKQLSEKKAVNADGEKSLLAGGKSFEKTQKSLDAGASPKANRRETVIDNSSTLFSEPPQDKKSSWLMPIIVVAFLLIGGVGAGIWALRSPNVAAESKLLPPPVEQEALVTDNPPPPSPSEPALQPTIEEVSTTEPVPEPSSPAVFTDKPTNQPAPKIKPAAPQQPTPRTAKPTVPKAPANQKKTVTVDDLIGGN